MMKEMTGTICRSAIGTDGLIVGAGTLSIYSDEVSVFEYQCMLGCRVYSYLINEKL